jgi:hypothetical protein
MQVYVTNAISYDFKAALDEAVAPQPTTGLTAEQRYWRTQFPEAPTPEDLRKYDERFGSEGVQEIADAYGVDLNASTPARRPERLTASRSKRSVQRAKAALA